MHKERETEGERERKTETHIYIYIYIYKSVGITIQGKTTATSKLATDKGLQDFARFL